MEVFLIFNEISFSSEFSDKEMQKLYSLETFSRIINFSRGSFFLIIERLFFNLSVLYFAKIAKFAKWCKMISCDDHF